MKSTISFALLCATVVGVSPALAVSGIAILVRLVWVFPDAYLPRRLNRHIRETEPRPAWQNVIIVGWCGMRGIVSLAAALALPAVTAPGESFPARDLLVFLTFAVIAATLILQGLTLAPLMYWLKMKPEGVCRKRSGMLAGKSAAQRSKRCAGSVVMKCYRSVRSHPYWLNTQAACAQSIRWITAKRPIRSAGYG